MFLRGAPAAAATLWGAATVAFLLLRAVPGDPATALAGERADPETVRQIRARWGLDRSVALQYLTYLGRLCRGDLGNSIATRRPVLSEIRDRLPATLELTLAALALALAIGVPLGVAAGRRAGSWMDVGVSAVSSLGVSVPVFVTGYALILVKVYGNFSGFAFAGRLPEDSAIPFSTSFYLLESLARFSPEALAQALSHLALPAATLATVPAALFARIARAGVVAASHETFVAAARARGLSERRLLAVHILPNVAVTLVAALGLSAGTLIGGAVLTETVFAWPGMGSLFTQALAARDYPVIQGMILTSCAAVLAANALVGFLDPLLDPRLREA